MDKLLDKEVHQLVKASPNDPEMSNYVVSSCVKHGSAASVEAADGSLGADEGIGGEDLKPDVTADAATGPQDKAKTKSLALLGYVTVHLLLVFNVLFSM